MNAVIYTKPGCVYCDKAKDLLMDMDIPFVEAPIVDYKTLYLGDAEAHCKAPQIFLDGEHVGGYTELSSRLLG